MNDTNLTYCDKCRRPIEKQPSFDHLNYNICSECAYNLYQKIYKSEKGDKQ